MQIPSANETSTSKAPQTDRPEQSSRATSTTPNWTPSRGPAPRERLTATASTPRRAAIQPANVATLFQGEIQPVRTSLPYMLGMALVAATMAVLPLIYIGMIVLTGWGAYYHAVNHVGMLAYGTGRGKLLVFLAYAAPIVVGAISVFFMIKPLLAPPSRQVRTRSLTRQGEPLLFAFVERLCQSLGAPQPKRIDVDYQLNASASFRRGLLSFLGSDLVLTIGVPLMAGLSLQQFAGVLAHEFGHFSQGSAMRLSYLIRRINYWFARVVYERDEWDDWLADTASEVDMRFGWILFLSQGLVVISRGVLWTLMIVGHTISGFLLRQMEYDADRHAARLAGSEAFIETTRQLAVLDAAHSATHRTLAQFVSEHVLPDNLPKMLLRLVEAMPEEVRGDVLKLQSQGKTGILSTHPSDKDRIANAQREAAPGIIHVEGPASQLIVDFDSTARNVTWDFYCAQLSNIRPDAMTPVDKLLKENLADASSSEDDNSIPID